MREIIIADPRSHSQEDVFIVNRDITGKINYVAQGILSMNCEKESINLQGNKSYIFKPNTLNGKIYIPDVDDLSKVKKLPFDSSGIYHAKENKQDSTDVLRTTNTVYSLTNPDIEKIVSLIPEIVNEVSDISERYRDKSEIAIIFEELRKRNHPLMRNAQTTLYATDNTEQFFEDLFYVIEKLHPNKEIDRIKDKWD